MEYRIKIEIPHRSGTFSVFADPNNIKVCYQRDGGEPIIANTDSSDVKCEKYISIIAEKVSNGTLLWVRVKGGREATYLTLENMRNAFVSSYLCKDT